MTDRPEAPDLLDEARRHLLEVLLPLVPPHHRYDGLMVGNAMAIASRAARLGLGLRRDEAGELATLLGAPSEPAAKLADLERRLVEDVRGGVYDAAGPRREAVRNYLRASTEGRVRLSNPKALAGS